MLGKHAFDGKVEKRVRYQGAMLAGDFFKEDVDQLHHRLQIDDVVRRLFLERRG